MPRKNNENNPLQISIRAKSLPKSIKPKRYLQRLMEVISEGRELPSGWDVELSWRNPKTKHGHTKRWQTADFETAVSDSRAGFNALVFDALSRRLRRIL